MLKAYKNSYDAIIIGAGISGLVCGCYLAKAGMKVLIAEQHYKPGGYCTSFKRNGFTFDAAAHSFGGYKHGVLGKVFNELEIEKKVKFLRFDPLNVIITPDYKFSFWADLDRTIKEFQKAFPEESNNIKNFFYFLCNPDPNSFFRLNNLTFKNLLDQYFNNDKLKAIISFPVYVNGGLSPSLLSAFLAKKIYEEFIFDGGYYPEGSMQALSDALVQKFKEFGGDLRLSCFVKKIKVKDSKVTGVVIEKGDFIPSNYVISNCDAIQTFFNLLGKKIVSQDFLNRINNMIPSLSAFILYLGVDEYFHDLPEPGVNIWILSHYDLDSLYFSAKKGNFDSVGGYLIHVSPDKRTVVAFMNLSFKNKKYWSNYKEQLLESFITRIEMDAIPELSKYILYKEAATPITLNRYTLNYKGSAFGWAGTPTQLAVPGLRKPPFVQGLYLTGHWITQGFGISGVVQVGYDTAQIFLKTEKVMYG